MKHFISLLVSLLITAGGLFAQELPAFVGKYLEKNRLKWNLTPSDIISPEVTDSFTTPATGRTYLYFRQVYHGIPVTGTESMVVFSPGEKVEVVSVRFRNNIAGAVATVIPVISPRQAVGFAAEAMGSPVLQPLKVLTSAAGINGKTVFSTGGISQEPIPVSLALFSGESEQPVSLSWNLQIYTLTGEHWWDIWVDATDGQILHFADWVTACDPGFSPPGESAVQESLGAGEYHVFPLPLENPLIGPRSFVFDPSEPLASPFGWHDTNGISGEEFTTTRGNNVWAYEDQDGNNSGGFSPDGGASLDFDFPLDLSLPPGAGRDAAITNLFYWNNLMHDIWYRYGFDEVSGNFQENNYGRGGKGGDYVRAEAQDGSGRNNANFATPPDSARARMQMFLWGNGFDTLKVSIPGSVTVPYQAKASSFGPFLLHAFPVAGQMVIATDTANTTRACVPIANAAAVNGRIAVIDRGNCDFVTKVLRVQAAGAIAAIVINNAPGPPETMWTSGNLSNVTIPSIMISQSDGNLIRTQLNTGLQLTGTLLGFDMYNNTGIIDSDFDNGVIAHEYGHGISTRMTGGPSTSSCLSNEEQAGEGWSDWFALVMTTTANSQSNDRRPVGTYSNGQLPTGAGLRPFPYSTDMGINPVTYDHIKTLSVPHGVGFVMASMLWDMYWDLVDQYGYDSDIYYGTGGNNMAMHLVMEGIRIQPCSPGFADVRDAIIQADQLLYGGANECLIWKAFARRGLGFDADQGSSNARNDGTEGFSLPPQCAAILAITKTTDREKVSKNDTITYTFTVKNQTDADLTSVVVTDTLMLGLELVAASLDCGATANGSIVEIPVGNLASGQSFTCSFQATVAPGHPVSVLAYEDEFEDNLHTYTPISLTGTNPFVKDTVNPRSPSHAWFVPNAPAVNDQVLMTPALTFYGKPILSFWHSFDTEAEWDGGLVEILPTISTGKWQDLGAHMIENGYNSKVGINNPAGERPAFSGRSKGYIRTKIDLSAFNGQPIFIRFRFVSDDNTSQTGWWIDDLLITQGEEVNLQNTACVTSAEGPGSCDNLDNPHLIVPVWATKAEENLPALGVNLYPNPASEEVEIAVSGANARRFKVVVYDHTGRHVMEKEATGSETKLDISHLSSGVYMIKISSGSQASFQKLVVL
ncbi:MAG: T9SS-dependent M36 family metallopeptidase [Bacteroidia bacterium]